MKAKRRQRKRSQFMARRAKQFPPADRKPVKRPRNPRVSTYLTPELMIRFSAYRKGHGCDASTVVLRAITGLLEAVDPAVTADALAREAARAYLRQIVIQGTYVLRNVHWGPLLLKPDEPLERHWDAVLKSADLVQMEVSLRDLVRRVAELAKTTPDQRRPVAPSGAADASPPKPAEEGKA